MKFTGTGGAIRVHCTLERWAAATGVSDTGIGIPPQHRRRIFDPFVQVDATRCVRRTA